ncbi:peptide chain release factor N(5)-glutamine methyltransferase [Candidatus Kaiserbacteria bacterium]|nr:peptide chain release factor N(5)-glutamine methyltransferase [Candidatus Kaiserbacteria bacterium]
MTKEEKWLLEEKYGGKEGAEFEADKERLASGEPLAYVIGWQPFLGLKIYLDSKPLIPRPETEYWIDQLLSNLEASLPNEPQLGSEASKLRFLDLCAGSGAIGCAALARLLKTEVYFGEIDPVHEETIVKNIRENHLDESRAEIRISNLFEPFNGMQFDVIAINPPYIPSGRKLERSVADYEPAQALYAGDDGLALIRRIAVELPKHLVEGGKAWIECDSAHAAEAAALFTEQNFKVEIRNDQYDKPRVIVVSK